MDKAPGKLTICCALSCLVLTGCPVQQGGDGDAPGFTFTIGDKTFGFTMGTTGIFFQNAGDPPQQKAAAIPLFEDPPDDRPISAAIALDVGKVTAVPLSVPTKSQASLQTISGSADVTIRIGDSNSTSPCTGGVEIGTFELEFSAGVVSVGDPELDLPSTALNFVITGSFTICLEVTSTVDVELTIGELECVFGPSANDNEDFNGNVSTDAPECRTQADCQDGMVCNEDLVCVPAGAGDGSCASDADCPAGQVCRDDLVCVPDAGGGTDVGDFSVATISRRGAEHVILGPEADPNLSLRSPPGYAPGPFGAKAFALSGDGTKVWVALYDQFPDVEGDPQTQLWSVNTDGTGGVRSSLPAEDIRDGMHVATNIDGSVVVTENPRTTTFYRASPGTGVSALYNYADLEGIGDSRGVMRISDDASRLIYSSFTNGNMVVADISGGTASPQVLTSTASLITNGIIGTSMEFQLDISSSADTWIVGTRTYDPDLFRNRWPIFIGNGLTSPAISLVTTARDDLGFNRFNMTDNGATIGYCRATEFNGLIGRCFIQSVGSDERTEIVDEVLNVGNLSLSDDGRKAYMSTNVGYADGGEGFIYDVATGERYVGGSQWFSDKSSPDFTSVEWSDDGRLLMAAVSRGIYVLHDGSVPAGFPSIDRILYRMNDEECSMTVRVEVDAPLGINRIFTLPFYQGQEASRGAIPGEENPLFRDRSGGGVNKSTTFTMLETGVWEREVFLTNSEGQCASSFLSSDFSIRIVLVEATTTRTVFADFVPAP